MLYRINQSHGYWLVVVSFFCTLYSSGGKPDIISIKNKLCDEFTSAKPDPGEFGIPSGLPSDREVCEMRVTKLYKQIVEAYPSGFSEYAVDNAYLGYLSEPYTTGRYKGFDQSERGLRIQIIDKEVWYWGQPNGRYDSLQYIEPTLTMIARTANMYDVPNVDITTLFGDICPDKRDTMRAAQLKKLKDLNDENSKKQITQLETDIAPVFAYGAKKDCYGIAMPVYDWMWDVQNFMSGSSWRSDSRAESVPWDKKEADAVWRGQVFGSRMRVRACAAGLAYPELINAHFTGFSKNLKFDRAWCNDLWLQNEEAAPAGTPAGIIPELEPTLPELPKPKIELKDSENQCEAALGNKVPFHLFLDHKYLLDIDGWGSTFRFKNLLLAEVVTLKVENDMFQFFYDELIPYVHFVPVGRDKILEELPAKLVWLKGNDTLAHKIAVTSTLWVQRHLTDQHANWYQYAAMYIMSHHTHKPPTKPSRGFKKFCCSDLSSHIYKRYCIDGSSCRQEEEKQKQVAVAQEIQELEDTFLRDLDSLLEEVKQMTDKIEGLQKALTKVAETQEEIDSEVTRIVSISDAQQSYSVSVLKVMYQQMVLHVKLQLDEINKQLPSLSLENQRTACVLIEGMKERINSFNETAARTNLDVP